MTRVLKTARISAFFNLCLGGGEEEALPHKLTNVSSLIRFRGPTQSYAGAAGGERNPRTPNGQKGGLGATVRGAKAFDRGERFFACESADVFLHRSPQRGGTHREGHSWIPD